MRGDSELAAMDVLRRAVEGATARTVFGEPVTHGDVMIIPVARVLSAGGGGGGGGSTAPAGPPGGPYGGHLAGLAGLAGGIRGAAGPGAVSGPGSGLGPGSGSASGGLGADDPGVSGLGRSGSGMDLPPGLDDGTGGLADVDSASLEGIGLDPLTVGGGADRGAAGTGAGLAMAARPMGVYVIRDGKVAWRPAVDINKVILGGQIVGIVALLALRALIRSAARAQANAGTRVGSTPGAVGGPGPHPRLWPGGHLRGHLTGLLRRDRAHADPHHRARGHAARRRCTCAAHTGPS